MSNANVSPLSPDLLSMFSVKLAFTSPKVFLMLHLYKPESSRFGSLSSNRMVYESPMADSNSLIWLLSVMVVPSFVQVISGFGHAFTLHSIITSLPLFSDMMRGFSMNDGPSPSGSGSASIFKLRFALLSPNSFLT